MPGIIKIKENSLPVGFPSRLDGPLAWSPSDIQNASSYVCQLTGSDLMAIQNALKHFKGLGITPHAMEREHFPLPQDVADKFRAVSDTVHNGRGFVVLRGLDPQKYTAEDNVLIYGGITSHVGTDRSEMIHIYDRAGGNQNREMKTKYPPNEISIPMDFHTDVDAGDILSLYTLGLPKSGGRQHLVSFWTVYNDLAANDPDALHTLASDWRYEMATPHGVKVINRPAVYNVDGKMQINFATAFLRGSSYVPRLPGGPGLSKDRQQAVEALLASCRRHSVPIDQQVGDMLFVNNLGMLHARGEFVDDAPSGQVRHLLSVMLRDCDEEWYKDERLAAEVDKRFEKLDLTRPQFFGTVKEYEIFRDKFAMLRHD